MENDQWRAAIIVERKDAKYMDIGIQRLRAAGFENIHVMASEGVTISKRYQPMSHQAKEWTDGYSLWRGASELLGKIYTSRSQLFLLMRPNFHLWGDLMRYGELTIDQRLLAVWSPFTPNRVFPSSNQTRPSCEGSFGWCPTAMNADASVADCLIMTGHMLTLVGQYLPAVSAGGQVGSAIAAAMERQGVPFYYHLPSLVTTAEHTLEADDFVGVTFDMSRKDMLTGSFLLNPSTPRRRKTGSMTCVPSNSYQNASSPPTVVKKPRLGS